MKLSRSSRFWVATILWCAVGIMLIVRGVRFGLAAEPPISTRFLVIAFAVSLVVGVGKGLFVLSRSAARNAAFITRRPEQDWLWFSVHPVMYILIPFMILLGWSLKHFVGKEHPAVVLSVYVAIGLALIIGARGMWKKRAEG